MLESMFEDFKWSQAEVAEEAAANTVRILRADLHDGSSFSDASRS